MKYTHLLSWMILAISTFSQSDINEYLNVVKTNFDKSSILSESIISENDILFIGETHSFRENYTIVYQFI